ncbi:hypothetical protein J14TS2_44440 [Bacillus sp. J14TS2]|uniref:hypothetical protein n=1 Tax=Bacillus sp. J14TS2 TaxID=2807188 RepID=UPI001B19D113|nr:hypothetical protein [Bacillus sp. J14TS2]GIN73969.1 hypothetical protein J14TS2_44440 [Bacillus sp. J14TS2]
MGILMAIAPVVIVGGIAVFVIKRLQYKYNQGTLGKKETKGAQNLLNSLIPMGMIFGAAIGVVFGIFSSISLPTTISLGAGIGFLFGYFAYEYYSKEENNYS